MRLKKIDVHHHFYTEQLIQDLAAAGIPEGGGAQFPKWNPELSLEAMERHGIDAAVLSVPIPVWYLGNEERAARSARALNECGAQIVAQYPQKFGFMAVLPLPDVARTLAEIEYAFDTLKADGVCLASNYAGIYLGDVRFAPVFEALDKRGAVVMVHPVVALGAEVPSAKNAGSPIPGIEPSLFEFIFDTTRAVASLVTSGTIKRFANIRFTISHAGGCVPFVANRIVDRSEILAFYTKVQKGEVPPPAPGVLEHMVKEATEDSLRQLATLYYDTTFSVNANVMSSLRQLTPLSHLVLGTDFPMGHEIGLATNLTAIQNYADFSEQERLAVKTNAAELFPRLAS